ncbi:MAG: Y-family DNA polymerase [Bacteriovoracaceae bacterium]|nr:Y-family DNA polymerase [Bacteriovoracaceae bacterium]
MGKLFGLIDCNNFYVSCERLFRPVLNTQPVIVLSNNDGCVVSRSKEAKDIGIPMAAPFFKVIPLIKKYGVSVFSSNYVLYGDISSRVMRVISENVPDIEVYSIDEAFVDLSEMDEEKAYAMMSELVKKIYKWVGVPVTVGIAPTRTLAKVACNEAKKIGIECLSLCSDRMQDQVLKKTPVGDIWGIGRQSKEKLYFAGVKSALELKYADMREVETILGVVGKRKVLELNNLDSVASDSIYEHKKSISSSKSFSKSIVELDDLREAIIFYATRTAEKLRGQGSVCQQVSVFITTGPFAEKHYYNSKNIFFATPSGSTKKIINAALHSLDTIFREGVEYKKAGVSLGGIVSESEYQVSLFDPVDEVDDNLMKAMDKINGKLGRDSVNFGVVKKKSPWQSNANYKSQNYTTSWSEILKVK